MIIEDDNHIVLFDEQRRISEIPWREQQDDSFTGSIKDLIYSSYLEQFCILSSLNFFTLDPSMLTLEKSEQLRPRTGKKIYNWTKILFPNLNTCRNLVIQIDILFCESLMKVSRKNNAFGRNIWNSIIVSDCRLFQVSLFFCGIRGVFLDLKVDLF